MADERLERILAALRAEGGRSTVQRRVVIGALLDSPRHTTAEELAAIVQARHPDIATSTIYRTLESLERQGIVQHAHLGHGPAVYHVMDNGHTTEEATIVGTEHRKGARQGPVLVVDDDRVARHLAASALAAAGVETVEAVTGRQALDLLAHGTFAAVLLDNHMPGLSGLDVLGAIRAEPATRTLPVLLVTADEDVTDRVRGLRAGASDYLVKPYDPDELVARVDAHLENQTAWSEVVESHLAQRAAMAEAVRQAGGNATPESLADIVCAELQRGGRRSGVVVIGIVGDAVALPLAARDIAAWNVEPGRLLPPALARYLVDRGEHGPWLEHLDDAGAAALPGGPFPDDATMACAPITWNGDLLGVLMVRVDGTGRRAGGAETSAALREVVDFAGVAA